MKYSAADEKSLMTELWDPALAEDLRRFVMFVYPWGKAGTPLAGHKEPRKWQIEDLEEITDQIRANKNRMLLSTPPLIFKKSTVSGRGVGKSALVSWLGHWMMSTNLGSSTIVTANTETQLKSRTMAEVGKWHAMALNSHWFEKNAMSVRPQAWFSQALKRDLGIDDTYYYTLAQLWSEDNPDAFAGVHNHNGILLLFDEASGIPQPIWTVSDGFFTEPILHRYWNAYSNGRRPNGAFFECFHKNREAWRNRHLDSRTVEGTDLAIYEAIIKQYGEDSDQARVEVKGQFPRQGERQFIPRNLVLEAQTRELMQNPHEPLVMGVDCARMGDDESVIRWRQGRDARSIPPRKFRRITSDQLEDEIIKAIEDTDPDGVCLDAGNIGAAIKDNLKRRGYMVHEVWFGATSTDEHWADKSTEMWAEIRAWLPGGCIDKCPDLESDLCEREYGFEGRGSKIRLESVEHMKGPGRGLHSPDNASALGLTFAKRFARKNRRTSRDRHRNKASANGLDYRVLG